MNSWSDDFIQRYMTKLHKLTLSQILMGFEMVINNKDFDKCDKYFNDIKDSDRDEQPSPKKIFEKIEALGKLMKEKK